MEVRARSPLFGPRLDAPENAAGMVVSDDTPQIPRLSVTPGSPRTTPCLAATQKNVPARAITGHDGTTFGGVAHEDGRAAVAPRPPHDHACFSVTP